MATIAIISLILSIITGLYVYFNKEHNTIDKVWRSNIEGRISEVETTASRINAEYTSIREILNEQAPPPRK